FDVSFTASNINLQNLSATYYVQLDSGTLNSFTQNGTYTFKMDSGDYTGEGLQFFSSNTTAGDTLILDNISVLVNDFVPSTSEDSVQVTGDIKVPAGAQVLDNYAFDNWTGTLPNETVQDWTLAETPDADNYITYLSTGEGLIIESDDLSLNLSQNTLTPGKEYLVVVDVAIATVGFGFDILHDGQIVSQAITNDRSFTFVATGTDLTISSSQASTVSLDSIKAYELTTGPIDEYVKTGEILNDQPVYESVNEHADGLGSVTNWNVVFASGFWRITR
ncbi:unnamed protein product, partial [marine sediment metagenome]